MKTKSARVILENEFPLLLWEIEGYLSFAETSKFTEEKLVEDFTKFLNK